MTIDSNIIDHRGAAAEGRGPPVLSIALESMVMVLDCPCLALEAQSIQNLLHKPLMKFVTIQFRNRRFELKLGPNRSVSVQITRK